MFGVRAHDIGSRAYGLLVVQGIGSLGATRRVKGCKAAGSRLRGVRAPRLRGPGRRRRGYMVQGSAGSDEREGARRTVDVTVSTTDMTLTSMSAGS